MRDQFRQLSSIFGLAAVCVFFLTFIFCWLLTPSFDPLFDHLSKLGTIESPYGLLWNTVGFGLVGALLAVHGVCFGLARGDRTLALALLIGGVGFSIAAIPTDFADPNSTLTRAHYASLCISLGGWFCGMARMLSLSTLDTNTRLASYCTLMLVVVPLAAAETSASPEPLSHRMVLAVLFSWVMVNCLGGTEPESRSWITTR